MSRELVEQLVFDIMEDSSRKHYRPVPGRVVFQHCASAPNMRDGRNRPSSVHYNTNSQLNSSDHEKYYTASSESPRLKHRPVQRSATTSNIEQGVNTPREVKNGAVLNMKQKLTDNIEHYSNLFQEITFPILFRRSGRNQRSRSSSRNRSERKNSETQSAQARIISERTEENYPPLENIELYQFNGFVFGSERESGKGHNFQPVQLSAPTWCDLCSEFIWGVYKQCLRCQNCQYTCHHPCRKAISLDCAGVVQNEARPASEPLRSNQSETSLTNEKPQAVICDKSTVWFFKRTPSRRRFLFTQLSGIFNHVNPWASPSDDVIYEDDTDSGYHTGDGSLREQARRYHGISAAYPPRPKGEYTLTREELRNNVEAFNNNQHGLIMTLAQESNTFQGFIRVHIHLIRPINMSLAVRPPSLYEVLTHEDEHPPVTPPTPGDPNDTQIASFYLPKDTTKVIHISSDTSTEEVIKLLLSKFRITDNPRKFALYEQIDEGGVPTPPGQRSTGVMRKMAHDEQPLPLCLTWGSDGLQTHRFILHENDSGDVIWEAFSVPELNNFLAILNREQEEYVDQIRAKYSLMQIHITRRMQELAKQGAVSNLSSALTSKMADTKIAASSADIKRSDSVKSNSASPQLKPKTGDHGKLGVNKLKKSDVHKDTPRPGQFVTSQEESSDNQDENQRAKSPPAGTYTDDEREPVFV